MQIRKMFPNLFNNRFFKIELFLFGTILLIILNFSIVQVECQTVPLYGGTLIDCRCADAECFNPVLSEEIFNPILSVNSTSSYINSFIFERMITFDENMNVIPELALAWDISINKLDYTFYLREDVYWHDNVPFTADDVVFTCDRIRDLRTQTTRASMFDLLDQDNIPYEKLDDHTVVFHLRTTFAPMLNNMMFSLIPEHIFGPYSPAEGEGTYEFNDCPPNHNPVGTGSMMFYKWIHDDQIILKRNSQDNGGPGYWREHDAYIDTVIIKIIPEVTTQLLALKNGEIDMMDMSSTEASEIEATGGFPNSVLYTAPLFTYNHIAFNCDPSMGNHADIRNFTTEPNYFAGFNWMEDDSVKLPGPNIRKALNYAIDKDQIIEVAYPYGYRNLGPMYFAQNGWYYEGVERYDLDLDKANQLLNESGFGVDKDDPLRKKLNFTISYEQSNIRRQTVCNYAKGQWESLGLDVSVEAVEWVSMFNSHYDHRKFDTMSAGWTGGGVVPDLTNIWHSKSIMPGGKPSNYNPDTFVWEWEGDPVPGGMNYMGYWNPEVDNLLDIAREEPEQIVRKMYYDQIQEKIVDDSPYIWLFSQVTLVAVSEELHGMIQGSSAGLWPQPIGFHNIHKGYCPPPPTIGTTIPVSGSSSTSDGFVGDLSNFIPYFLPMLIIGGFFAVGAFFGRIFRKTK